MRGKNEAEPRFDARISDFDPVEGTGDSDAITQNSLPALSNACRVEASHIKY